MKRILAAVAIATMSTAAFAGGTFDYRGGYISVSQKDGATNSGIAADRARLHYNGQITEKSSAKAQYDLAAGSLKTYQLESAISDSFKITGGKLDDASYGTWENARAGADQYFFSWNYNRASYWAGFAFDYTLAEKQTLKLHLVNEGYGTSALTSASTPTTTGANSQGYGLRYTGWFGAHGIVASIWSVPVDPTTGVIVGANSTTANLTGVKSDAVTTFGYQFKQDAIKASVDMTMRTLATNSSAASASDAKTNSTVVMFDYDMGMYVPQFKFETSDYTAANQTLKATQTQYSLGTEIKPDPAASHRYQVMMVNNTKNTGASGAKDVVVTTMMAGVRWTGDFAK